MTGAVSNNKWGCANAVRCEVSVFECTSGVRPENDGNVAGVETMKQRLSLCIPTFNRGPLLHGLLRQMSEWDAGVREQIAICISDNASTDNTPQVIEHWKIPLSLQAIRQASNIGFTRNFQAVVAMSATPWTLVIGDDDLFCSGGLEGLLKMLATLPSDAWLLTNIRNQDGSTLLDPFQNGPIASAAFRKKLLTGGAVLERLGFISSHVFPQQAVRDLSALDPAEIHIWPHLSLFFRSQHKLRLFVHKPCIILRSGEGEVVTQTWRSLDWLGIMMQRTKLACNNGEARRVFPCLLALHEYFHWLYVRQLLHAVWATGQKSAVRQRCVEAIDDTPIGVPLQRFLKGYVNLLLLLPASLIEKAVECRKKRGRAGETSPVKSTVGADTTDGVDRGL